MSGSPAWSFSTQPFASAGIGIVTNAMSGVTFRPHLSGAAPIGQQPGSVINPKTSASGQSEAPHITPPDELDEEELLLDELLLDELLLDELLLDELLLLLLDVSPPDVETALVVSAELHAAAIMPIAAEIPKSQPNRFIVLVSFSLE